jgi:hypothetical protein
MNKIDAVESIVKYLSKYKNRLIELYSWKFDLDSINFLNEKDFELLQEIPVEENYKREVQLKSILQKYLKFTPDEVSENQAVNWIIKEWGGIKTGGKLSKEQCNAIVSKNLPFSRIASLSKITAFMAPKECVIYDSRVAYALNWILLSDDVDQLYFPIPDGRNSKMMAFDMNVLIHLKNKENYSIKDPLNISKQFISNQDRNIFLDKNEAYKVLNDLIKSVSELLWKGDKEKQENLFYTEMLLFSIADTYVTKDILEKTTLKIN